MDDLDKDKKPPEDILKFIEGFIQVNGIFNSFSRIGTLVGQESNLFERISIKLAKDIVNLEYLSGNER